MKWKRDKTRTNTTNLRIGRYSVASVSYSVMFKEDEDKPYCVNIRLPITIKETLKRYEGERAAQMFAETVIKHFYDTLTAAFDIEEGKKS